jgi:hypothetical protein
MTNRNSTYAGFALACLATAFGLGLMGSMLIGETSAAPGTIIAATLLTIVGWIAGVRGAGRILPGMGIGMDTAESSEPAGGSTVVESGRGHTPGWWITRYALLVLALSAACLVVAVSTESGWAWAAALIGIVQAPLTISFGRRMDG